MKLYEVKTRFEFAGNFHITAESKTQAREYVEKHCGLVLNGPIHTTLPDDVVDWDFPVHPEKTISWIRVNS